MAKLRLREKFIIIISATIFLISLLFMIWFSVSQKNMMQSEMLEKARVMTREMDAVWEFVEINQNRINYNRAGEYEFKGLYCSIVGKSVGALFSRDSDYEFHYTSLAPRNLVDRPDDFEETAMKALKQDPARLDYYEITEYGGKTVFRYVSELSAKKSCLTCHGEPKGELDETGYEKEGLQIGDTVGAISIIMPMETYQADLKRNTANGFLFFVLLMILISLILYISISRLVILPLHHLQNGVNEMKKSHSEVWLEEKKNYGEISELLTCFNEMSQELNSVYENLEGQVEKRTGELLALNRVLEQKQIQLEEVNQSLRDENQSKSDFLAVMTHELRTPLASIITFAQILRENEADHSEEENDTLRRIEQSGRRLLETVNNTLDIFRMEADKMKLSLEMVDIYDIANRLEEWAAPLAAQKEIRLTVRMEKNIPMFNADYEMLYHTLENLLGNAVKFTGEGGEIEMTAEHREDEKKIRLRVKDSGIGIDKEYQEAIFDKYVQMNVSASRKYIGSGLGLTLVKNWVRMHGGRVSVESEPGKGSTFTVEIPSDLERPVPEKKKRSGDRAGEI